MFNIANAGMRKVHLVWRAFTPANQGTGGRCGSYQLESQIALAPNILAYFKEK
jgi:hypothetical protein